MWIIRGNARLAIIQFSGNKMKLTIKGKAIELDDTVIQKVQDGFGLSNRSFVDFAFLTFCCKQLMEDYEKLLQSIELIKERQEDVGILLGAAIFMTMVECEIDKIIGFQKELGFISPDFEWKDCIEKKEG